MSAPRGRTTIEWVRAAVVGAGPAGLAASTALAQAGVRHIVLERGRVGSSWRTQRWDSFRLNSPNWANRIPGDCLTGAPETFATAASFLAGLERFAADLPVFEGIEVVRAERVGPIWRLETSNGVVVAADLVVASGFQNQPRRPDFAAALPPDIVQLHSAEYRRPDDLDGSILVVGGGQSGVQIADDLLDAGKRVYLATSRVGRMPRRYRGRDAFEWMRDTGQLDLATEAADPALFGAPPPQISGAGGGRTISYQHLARRGATLLGRAAGFVDGRLVLQQDLGANIWFADETSRIARAAWDKLLPAGARGARDDVADEPAHEFHMLTGPASLDLAAAGITTVIWATGFRPTTEWLPKDALAEGARPQLPGLHAIGAPWLSHRSSSNLYGMVTDAARILRAIDDVQLGVAA